MSCKLNMSNTYYDKNDPKSNLIYIKYKTIIYESNCITYKNQYNIT